MRDADWAECAVALEVFPGEFKPRTAESYRRLLDGLSKDEVLGAVRAYVRKGEKFRPTPGEIVALAGRAVALPPFGVLRQALTLACQRTPVRLARHDVSNVLCRQLEGQPLAQAFVTAVGGERIRRVVLYTPETDIERAWDALGRDYRGLEPLLIDTQFTVLEAGAERRELTG